MVKNAITVFARVKPEKIRKKIVNYEIHRRSGKLSNEDFLVLTGPRRFADCVDNRPESWNFSFHRIFEHDVVQDEVFESVARPVVDSVFDGYNATIFAYGQTGSGKTYSITGESGIHAERGILPRTLQYIFQIVEKNPENLYTVEVAYLEIYNENGYDLLLEREEREAATRIEDLPRVTIQEDDEGTMHLKNLSFRIVQNEKEALRFLIDGDACRAISETPMNPRSSRSHCIFTIVVSVKKFGANRYSRAKMHLVDLAGSERVYKCAIQGTILTEAKHINLSLHFLEQVIVCLGQDNVTHVPYRNSLLTSVLRDSLGGNCLTTMLATLSVNNFNLEETISTCRFAQRVALVKNNVNLTFELDTKSENMLLKLENEKLRRQIEELKNGNVLNVASRGSVDYYKNLVIQRDQEISHLIDLLEKERSQRKSAMRQITEAATELRKDEKCTQIPSDRSQRNNDQVSTTKSMIRKKYENFRKGKSGMSPERDLTESLEVTRRASNSSRRERSRNFEIQVPDLKLKEKNYSVVRHDRKHDQRELEPRETDTNRSIISAIVTVDNRPKQSSNSPIDQNVRTPKVAKSDIIDTNDLLNVKAVEVTATNEITSEINNITSERNSAINCNFQTNELSSAPTERRIRIEKIENTTGNCRDNDCSKKYEKINESLTNEKLSDVDNVESFAIDGANKSQIIKSSKIQIKNNHKTPKDEFLLIKDSDDDKSKISRSTEICSKKNTPRENFTRSEFLQKIVKTLPTSDDRSTDDRDEGVSLADSSENPNSGFETSNVVRNNLFTESNPTVKSFERVENKRSSEPTKIIRDENTDNIVETPLSLTGDPDIDEELIAFYRAKRQGRLY